MSDYNTHIPVMLEEVLSFVDFKKKITYVDMTLGRGGHASKILAKLKKGSKFYGIDRDVDAISYCKDFLKDYQNKVQLNFINSDYLNGIDKVKEYDEIGADLILMDIGVSSPQFDDPKRGFSYRFDSPLDMRMSQAQKLTASEIINHYDEENLTRVFRDLGECKHFTNVVKNIIEQRKCEEIKTTFELVELIKRSLPKSDLKKEGHPTKQFFLGLRYEVNGEIDQLKQGIEKAIDFLNPKGRLIVITFNSEEDKIVKEAFKRRDDESHFDKYGKNQNLSPYVVLTRKPLLPTEEEIQENNRCKPSIMRVIERR